MIGVATPVSGPRSRDPVHRRSGAGADLRHDGSPPSDPSCPDRAVVDGLGRVFVAVPLAPRRGWGWNRGSRVTRSRADGAAGELASDLALPGAGRRGHLREIRGRLRLDGPRAWFSIFGCLRSAPFPTRSGRRCSGRAWAGERASSLRWRIRRGSGPRRRPRAGGASFSRPSHPEPDPPPGRRQRVDRRPLATSTSGGDVRRWSSIDPIWGTGGARYEPLETFHLRR